MSNNLKFSIVFEAVTAQFNGAIATTKTSFDAAAAQIQKSANGIGSSTASASQQAMRAGEATSRAMGGAAKATEQLNQSSKKLEDQSKKTNAELSRANNITDQLGGSWGRLSGILATFGIGVSAKEIIDMADAFKNLQAVVGLAAGEGRSFETAFAGVREIANSTFTPLQQTADLFRKVTEATRVLGITQQEVFDITRTVNQAVQLSGASATGAAGAILQFNQALASGRLSGQEFNSVSEQAPRLLKIFSDELGLTIGEIRKLAFSQKLTTDILLESLKNQADKVAGEFEKIQLTVGRSLTVFKNQLIDYIGNADAANGVTSEIANAVVTLAKNLDEAAAVLKFLITAALAFKAVDLATAMFARANAATAAAAALRLEYAAIVQGTAATTASSTATVTNTTVTNTNTAATTANAAATTQAAAAKNSLAAANTQAAASASVVNRTLGGTTQNLQAAGQSALALGSRLVGALSIAGLVYLAISLLKQMGEGIAALAAKATGLSKAMEESTKVVEESDKKVKEIQDTYKKALESAQAFADRLVGLSKESQALVARFDDLKKSGKEVGEALKELSKDMSFSNLKGINNAITALNALALQGKASGEEVRKALQDSLANVDLVTFKTNAAAAFGALNAQVIKDIDKLTADILKKEAEREKLLEQSRSAASSKERIEAFKAAEAIETQVANTKAKISELRGQVEQEAAKMALVHDAVLDEAVRRTGVAYNILKGEVGAASRSAINDIDLIAQNLSELKDQGIDTGMALGASLLQGIERADTQQALDLVKSRVIALRGELDQKVVDGLLNEASRQALKLQDDLDDAAAGINSVREAFREFGLKTREEYQAVADRQKAAFEEMQSSGKATASQLQEAFKKYAENAIAANGGVADGFVLAQAAILGFEVKTNDAGETVVESMAKAKEATDRLTGSSYGAAGGYQNLGNAAEMAGNQAVQSIEEQIAATQRLRQEQAKTRDEALSAQRGAPVNSADNLGGVSIAAYSKENIMQRLVSELGFDQSKAMVEAQRIFQSYIDTERTKAPWQASFSNAGFVDAELLRLAKYTSGRVGSSALNGLGDNGVAKTTNVNITSGGKTVNTNVPADQEQDFLSMLGQARNVNGG